MKAPQPAVRPSSLTFASTNCCTSAVDDDDADEDDAIGRPSSRDGPVCDALVHRCLCASSATDACGIAVTRSASAAPASLAEPTDEATDLTPGLLMGQPPDATLAAPLPLPPHPSTPQFALQHDSLGSPLFGDELQEGHRSLFSNRCRKGVAAAAAAGPLEDCGDSDASRTARDATNDRSASSSPRNSSSSFCTSPAYAAPSDSSSSAPRCSPL